MKKIYYIFLLSSLIARGQAPSNVPTQGLKGWWPFCSNANDLSTNSNNGVVNGATLTTDRFGNANSAYSFNGNGNSISTTYSGILNSNSRTISFWAKTTNSVPGGMMAVSWGSDNASGSSFRCGFNVYVAGVSIDGGNSCTKTYPTTDFVDDQWHHYVFLMSSQSTVGNIDIYMDGILMASNPYLVNEDQIMNTGNQFKVTFGKLAGTTNVYSFDGQLDDIGIWDRVLSTQEISNLYQATASCNLSSIAELSNNNVFFELYPNPANERLVINIKDEFANSIEDVEVKIYTVDGKCIGYEKLNLIKSNLSEINISNLESGIYFVELASKKQTFTKKFIKN